jgi:hypothetical protein
MRSSGSLETTRASACEASGLPATKAAPPSRSGERVGAPVEPHVRLALAVVGAVAAEAVLREDRLHLAREVDAARGLGVSDDTFVLRCCSGDEERRAEQEAHGA